MSGFFGGLVDLVENVATVALAPISVAVDVARVATVPVAVVAGTIAGAANEVADVVAEELKGTATPLKNK